MDMVLPACLVVVATAALVRPPALLPRGKVQALALRGGSAASMNLAALGSAYSGLLVTHPVAVKSVTSCCIFALSDVAAQTIAPPSDGRDAKRTITTALIGLLYFGPVLHYYLNMITRLVPGSGFRSTLLKTLLGQLGFGPAITCIFFGAFLVADNGVVAGLAQWPRKIRQDLLVTWASELCFWPFVDLICYGMVPVRWIPLGYNLANFFWTIFLSLQASRSLKPGS